MAAGRRQALRTVRRFGALNDRLAARLVLDETQTLDPRLRSERCAPHAVKTLGQGIAPALAVILP